MARPRNSVVACKIKHLQKRFSVLFYVYVTTSKCVWQMFYAKTFAKMLQNICKAFLQML